MRYVKFEDLKSGMALANNVYENDGVLLLKAGSELAPHIIEKIKRLGYAGLYVYDNNEIPWNPPLISEEYRNRVIQSLKKMNIEECRKHTEYIVEQVVGQRNVILESFHLSTAHNYTYSHSVNVCISSVVIGIGMELSRKELEQLALSALLHDIGKLVIDSEILEKPGKLTEEEYEEMKRHAEYGYKLLKDNNDIASVTKMGIYEHHENEDGSGYPRGLTTERIHAFAKIIHVADVFDALTAKRCYKEAMNPADAMEYLMAHSHQMFQAEIVRVFLRYVALYPLGSTVTLSNGRKAVVALNRPSFLARPTVVTEDGAVIDLLEVKNLTITGLCI